MTFHAGVRLGHYRIISLLGRGGMADVYRAEDERLGREVALKAVPPEFARDPERVERFEREVRAAARLTHPNIVTVHEFGQGAGQHFYTMALMPGGDLKARIRAHPEGMPPSEARAVAAAMARALDYAHQQGFVHRDVKPENILFGEDGAPQLTDFGIARSMSSGARMTATGMSIGSPHYMSPEQARGKEVDGRSDLYSLGVVLYEMLTGRVPFDAADTFAVGLSHINDPVPELPPAQQDWQPVVDRLLAKSPDDRFGSAAELAKILASDAPAQAPATRVMPTGRDLGFPARPQEPATRLADAPNRQRRTLVAVAGGALLALAVVGIGYVTLQDTAGPERRPPTGGGGSAAVQPAPVQTAPPSSPTNPFEVDDREPERSAPELNEELRQLEEARQQVEEARRQAEAVLRQAEEARRRAEEVSLQANRAAAADRSLVETAPASRAGDSQEFDGIEFVWIPAGEFRMGSTSRRAEQPIRQVRISQGLWLGKHEVTQAEWQRVMGSNPSRFDECGPTCPVEMVGWNDAQEFIGRLNARGGGNRYRLPTEAEWEYAARSGTTTGYWWGNEIGDNRANCNGCGSQWDRETAPVGSFAVNAWGLHDVHGNVWEWVEDCWHGNYEGAPGDGSAWTSSGDCSRRVLRGGSWFDLPRSLRAALRIRVDVGLRDDSVGFRVARTPD